MVFSMLFQFALPYRQNITDYIPVKYALLNAISTSTGISSTNVVIAGSQQSSLCAVPIQKTSSALPFLKILIDREATTEQDSNMDWLNPLKRFQASNSKKSTVSFAIYSGVKGTNILDYSQLVRI